MTANVAQETGLNMIECLECGEEMGREDAFLGPDNEHYCEDCYDDLFAVCERCEDVVPRDDLIAVENEAWCEYCVDRHAVECDNCNDLVRHEYAYRDYNITVCDVCYENSYTTCIECDSIVHIDDAHFENGDSYCPDCIPEEERVIYDWDEGPPLVFHRFHDQSRVFYGVELEVERCDSPVDRYDMAETIYEMASQLYCKRDGSLDDGIEIVSHPADYDFHMQKLPWRDVLNRLASEGYRSHDAGTCGLHVHVSRAAFGKDVEEQEENIYRLLYLIEKFWPQWLRLSRRTESQMRQWASRYLSDNETPDRVPKSVLLNRAKNLGKYHAINLQKRHTIEFRLFRGTLNVNTFYATLQLVNYIVNLVTDPTADLERLSWEEVADELRNLTPELKRYMDERGL